MTAGVRQTPEFLVSVRSADEALAALAGGCDLLDVKEPGHGSLGTADAEVIAAVCHAAQTSQTPAPVSVALGELDEWSTDRPTLRLPEPVAFVKLGLSHCRGRADWPGRWRDVRRRFDEAAERPLGWIAVLYADATAEGPDSEALIDLAATTGCRGLLVDTFQKDGRRLFDHVRPERLAEWRSSASDVGLVFAVAGSLRAGDLPRLVSVRPDVVAVRGAVCRGGDRVAEVDAGEVGRFRAAMERAFGTDRW
jgi:uncharacterized protein (UPF0264 family)